MYRAIKIVSLVFLFTMSYKFSSAEEFIVYISRTDDSQAYILDEPSLASSIQSKEGVVNHILGIQYELFLVNDNKLEKILYICESEYENADFVIDENNSLKLLSVGDEERKKVKDHYNRLSDVKEGVSKQLFTFDGDSNGSGHAF